MKQKPRGKSSKKGRGGEVILLLILIGIGLIILFHQQIYNSIKPLLTRWGVFIEKREVLLYFSDSEGEYLIGEKRKILKKSDMKEEAREAIHELINGPKGKLIPTLVQVWFLESRAGRTMAGRCRFCFGPGTFTERLARRGNPGRCVFPAYVADSRFRACLYR